MVSTLVDQWGLNLHGALDVVGKHLCFPIRLYTPSEQDHVMLVPYPYILLSALHIVGEWQRFTEHTGLKGRHAAESGILELTCSSASA